MFVSDADYKKLKDLGFNLSDKKSIQCDKNKNACANVFWTKLGTFYFVREYKSSDGTAKNVREG